MRKWWAASAAAVCAALAMIGTTATSASAALDNPRTISAAAIGEQAASDAVRAYWTPERMRHAKPAAAPVGERVLPAANGKPGSTPAAAPAIGRSANAAPNAVPSRLGKVFYVDPWDNSHRSCDGNALNSPSRLLVITSASCVYSRAGHNWMRNWIFVPDTFQGSQPYGSFAAKQYIAFNAWVNDGSLNYDVAMVSTWNNQNNQRLVDAVGGDGLGWNWPRSVFVNSLGYSLQGFTSTCAGTTSALPDGRLEMPCAPVGGGKALGGPWLINIDPNSTLGVVDGVLSVAASNATIQSPYFTAEMKSMLDQIGSQT